MSLRLLSYEQRQQQAATEAVLEEMAVNPPKEFSTRISKGKPKVYKRVPGQLNGEDRYVRYLHAIGRKVSQPLV
jgi:hypothetical protein